MRRYGLGWIVCAAVFFQVGVAVAQSSLDVLDRELDEVGQRNQEVTEQNLSIFFTQIDAAMNSPEAAVALYQQAGGPPPDPAPVLTIHEVESVTEKEARLALDRANASKLGAVLQLHCGMMHYAALFAVKPDRKGLQEEWVAWLKSATQIYPEIGVPPPQSKKKRERDDGAPRPPTFDPSDLKGKAMRDSVIAKYLGFEAWRDKDSGGWSIRDVPRLYRAAVLDPLRAAPTAATLAAWDACIAMANADEPDNDRWKQVVYPPLQFDRACDDYAVAPGTEKLQTLVEIIRANPGHPKEEDWIARARQLMHDYRARHGGSAVAQNPSAAPAPAPSATTDPNVTVTTVHQGDMTIVTTHANPTRTNAPPVR